MEYRGSLGESLLHVLIICNSKLHTKLAKILLKVFPKLALDILEGEEYLGEPSGIRQDSDPVCITQACFKPSDPSSYIVS